MRKGRWEDEEGPLGGRGRAVGRMRKGRWEDEEGPLGG
jgi:hypothetical protein